MNPQPIRLPHHRRCFRLPRLPYPLRAAKLSIDLNPFGFWWKPSFHNFKRNEYAKAEGCCQWYVRWLWFQITFARWL